MFTHKKIRIISTIVLAAVFGFSTANAEITYDGFVSWDKNAGNGSLDASDSDKLVVVITGEHHFPASAAGQVNSVTYDGELLTKAVEVSPNVEEGGHGQTTIDIWYLDNPGDYHAAGSIAVSVSGNSFVYTAIALSGTVEGVGPTAAAGGAATVDLTTASANSVVISALGMGGLGNSATVDSVDPTNPEGVVEIDALWIGSKYAGHVVAYSIISTPGVQTFSFGTTKTDVAIVAATFEEAFIDPILPDVNAGVDMISWSGAAVDMIPVIVNNDTADPKGTLTYAWTVSPSDGVVFTPNDGGDGSTSSDQFPTVTITKAADTGDATAVAFTLTVTLDGVGSVEDRMTIDVYDNSCKAAINLDMVTFDAGDINGDCYTDLLDFAMVVEQWLFDYRVTAPTAK